MHKTVNIFGLLLGVAFMIYGAFYFVDPTRALAIAYHTPDKLPLVMGGRYALFGALLVAVLLYRDARVTCVLLIGFCWLALVDTLIYRATAPWPHAVTGLVCVAFAVYFYTQRKRPV